LANSFSDGRDVREVENKCLRAIFLSDPLIDRGDIINRNGARVDGTCEWITENETYVSWLSSRSQLLWLSGGPGKGKTTLSIYLAEKFEEHAQSCLVLEYYCSSPEGRNTTLAVIRGLIYQLLRRFPDLFRHVLPSFEIQSASLFNSFEAIWGIFVAMIRDPTLPTIYCILDGLDEISDEASLRLLLTKFGTLFTTRSRSIPGGSFKLVAVSREFPDCLLEQLSKFPHIRLDPVEDIRRFIDVRVDELAECRRYSATLSSHVKKVFEKRAEGTFLWIAVVAQELRRYAMTEVEDALNQFASGLDGLYTQMLRQINVDRREAAARILSWVTLAVRPLTIAELSEVLGTKSRASLGSHPEDVTKEHIKFCGNFLNVTESTVYLVHLSAKEFLLRKTTYSDPQLEIFRVDEYLGNLEIARKCLFYLQEGAFADGAFDIRKDRVRLEGFPLLRYATLHWFEHTRLLSNSEDIFDLSCPFYKQKSPVRASWLRTYWAVGELRKGGEPVSSPELFPLLHLASYFGILPLAQKIILKGRWKKTFHLNDERVNQTDGRGQTPLIWAAKNGHWPIVKLLLQEPNILADCRDASGETPLYLAAKAGHYTIAAVLLQRPDVIADSKNESGSTPLMIAALGGHEALVRLLMAREDVDINSRDNQGSSPLYRACWLGHESVVRLLLERSDIKPNLEEIRSQSPLHLAAREGHGAVVRLLLERTDVAPDSQNQSKDTPLHYAVEQGHEQVVRLLLGRPDVDVNKTTNLGSTPLNLAAQKGHGAIVRILLDRTDIEPDIADSNNRTPLSFAAQEGHTDIVALLLNRREVDINSKDFRGETPLHHAARLGHEGVVRLLLQRPDIEPDLLNIYDDTPIVKAAQSEDDPLWSGGGHEAIVRMLLERPDVNIDYTVDTAWRPLYEGARAGRNEGVIQLLQSLRPDWGSWTYKRKVRGGTLVERMAPSNL
jgi:ankyrin repeat protein